MATHLAAFVTGKGQPLEVQEKQTPKPGPDELLLDVKAIALNPIDWKMRDLGFFITKYPVVVGSDISGVVLEAGSNVSSTFKPGTRVAAFAPTVFVQGAPDYGAFQQRPIIPAQNATPIPDYLSFNEAAILPMAVATTWSGWETIGVSRNTSYSPSDKQGLLVWGAASSVGSVVVQSAKLLGFTVYATASSKHHAYIKSLGASKVFDYKDPGVEDAIIKAAKEDGLTFQYGYDAAGAIPSCHTILKALKGSGPAHLASAPRLSPDGPTTDDVETKFVAASPDDKVRHEQFSFWFNTWLKERLEKREIVPSPKIQVLEGGLHGINKGLEILKAGVSGIKLVLEL
ncbi:GroES-like protein [Daldinia decipiens]|uniref:GroES-like protein n=1 Tax=Daldinia decipiens TaxID=326647 RepID=UPI0020C34895|nr:GroES-like protein [Daldinia decipiens]KAI1653135.1 GroES-like protein [Daldinia decipiens]